MGWNGLDLVNDFASELGDTSPGFKTKVLRWVNDGLKTIWTAHLWPDAKEKGQAVLLAGKSNHSIVLQPPGAPTAALVAAGSLTDATIYKALITFYEAQSGVESIAGAPCELVITATPSLAFNLTDIPVSASRLVTERRVYISKAGGAYQYHGTIPHNQLTTLGDPILDGNGDPVLDAGGLPTFEADPVVYLVGSDATSMVYPPEEHAIFKIDGDLFIEGQRVLQGTSVQDLIFRSNGTPSKGTPTMWAPVNAHEVEVYPSPTSDITVSFYYYKLPAKVTGTTSSVPQVPSWAFDDLRRYVIWRGYQFRDRAGQESKEINFVNGLRSTISSKGKSNKRSGRVRSVTPDSDGYGV